MSKCIYCGKEFEPTSEYKNRKACSRRCYIEWRRLNLSKGFTDNQFEKGHKTFNKGVPQKEWMSEESMKKCSKTQIQNQKTAASKLSEEEGRFLPYNTMQKGTVVKRATVHKVGKNKGKTEYNYFINIDWKGNRKPGNLYKRYLWELYHQQDLPKGYVVITVDGDPDNLVINNLDIISRKELLRRNNGGKLGRRWN